MTTEEKKTGGKKVDALCMAEALNAARKHYGDENMYLSLGDSPWKTTDKEWFKAHPSRSFYIRRLLPNELKSLISGGRVEGSRQTRRAANRARAKHGRMTPETEANFTHVLVQQAAPGMRVRHVVAVTPAASLGFDALPDTDEIGMALLHMILSGRISVCDLRELVMEAQKIAALTSKGEQ